VLASAMPLATRKKPLGELNTLPSERLYALKIDWRKTRDQIRQEFGDFVKNDLEGKKFDKEKLKLRPKHRKLKALGALRFKNAGFTQEQTRVTARKRPLEHPIERAPDVLPNYDNEKSSWKAINEAQKRLAKQFQGLNPPGRSTDIS
jgi:hypothetical protein